MSSCDACIVRNRAICSELDPRELAALNAIGRRRQLKAGEALIWEGDDSVLVANVVEGLLKLTTGAADGREQIVGVAYPSDFIGRPFGATTSHSVIALTEAHVCIFPRADFDRFAGEHPALQHKLLQRTLAELDRTRTWMLLLARKSAEERIASFLLELASRLPEGNAQPASDRRGNSIELPFSRQQIGDILGLTIETVSRQLTALKRDGILALPSRRTIEILDRPALEALAG